MKRCFAGAMVAIFCLLALGCDLAETNRSEGNEIMVLVAASTNEAIKQIAYQFELRTGVGVVISSGPSNNLARQIVTGAPVDVFVSANQQWADAIVQSEPVEESTNLLTNRIVLIVRKGNPANVKQPSDLMANNIHRVAIAGENVPVGMYAEQALLKLGMYEQLTHENKFARGSDARVTLTYVQRGEAEAGIVYASDVIGATDVEVVYEFDPQSHEAIVYPLLLLKRVAMNPSAREFYEYLESDDATKVFEAYGFVSAK
ncbi:molybdate ABC transporter substrate-binding protein [Novipirellula aureliae]|uniref:molybdate ABC transporter substrate-binding protein n=1 Tax=Novipirellula aureliae TaxID=2527966 RepID=UPI0018CE7BA4|nr:molybdate ABC transporter substrate-binding protein [Novipirellula aureliae]